MTSALPKGPYHKRQAFLNRLWLESEAMIDQWRDQGIIPASIPGFIDYRLRLRRAKSLHSFLRSRYPDPIRELLRDVGKTWMN